MFDLDEMKLMWAEHDRKLDESIRLNRQLLTAAKLSGARSSLQRLSVWLALESAVWLAIVMTLGNFLYQHFGAPILAVSAAMVDVYAIAMLSAAIRQLAAVRQIDYSGPIATIQQQLGSLRVLRIRTTQWALLAGVVAWAPFMIVMSELLFGFHSYSVIWLCANIAFGLALIPLAIGLSRRFSERAGGYPFIQSLMNDIAGRNLNVAAAFLKSLAEFQEPAAHRP